MLVTSGNHVYTLKLSDNTFTDQTTDLSLTFDATMGGMCDGYFLALDTATSTLYLSDLLNGGAWDPLQFTQRSLAPDRWVSMAVVSDGSYGVPEGIISSFPCVCKDGRYEIVQGLDINDFSRSKIDASAAELVEERDAVRDLGLV